VALGDRDFAVEPGLGGRPARTERRPQDDRDRWAPPLEHGRMLEAEPGHTRLELADGVSLETLSRLTSSSGK
jgi:hypothetical protein